MKRINYYRLSAYMLPFRDDKRIYRHGTSFELAARIYDFDAKMRGLIFQVIEEIELYLRTQFAYWHSHTYGALGYLIKGNFGNRHQNDKFLKLIENEFEKNKNTAVIQHHIKQYDSKIPLWVIIGYFSMGMLFHFYADLKTPDKKVLAKSLFGTNIVCLDSWLRCITDLRNRCAHYSRLYYWKFSALPALSPGIKYTTNRRLYDQILVLKFLHPSHVKWRLFMLQLDDLLYHYENSVQLEHIGFPDNWKDILRTACL